MIRLMDRSKPRGSTQVFPTLATFLFASLWHGLYTSYYLFYTGVVLIEYAYKTAQKTALAKSLGESLPSAVVSFIQGFWALSAFHFMSAAFFLFDMDLIKQCWYN